MNEHAKNLTKRFALGALSNLTLEKVVRLDRLTLDGRCTLLSEAAPGCGGLCYYALKGIRSYDLDAALALGSLIGAEDHEQVQAYARPLGVDTHYLTPVPGKRTNRATVFLGAGDEKMILSFRPRIGFDDDLTVPRRRRFLGLIAQSRACLLGNLPLEATEHFLDFGRHVGTYMALGAGSKQLADIARFNPHALFLNLREAQKATGLVSNDSSKVFARLLEVSNAEHVVVMTGGGQHPTHIADRIAKTQWTLEPVHLQDNGRLFTLGAGDTLAGTVTFLLGMPRQLVSGELVLKAVQFAQEVVTAHLTGSDWARKRVRARYQELRPLFEPKARAAEDRKRKAG